MMHATPALERDRESASGCVSVARLACLQDAHAHGNCHANLFFVVHVIPEQEPPGQQREGEVAKGRPGCSRRVSQLPARQKRWSNDSHTSHKHAVVDSDRGRPAFSWKQIIPSFGRRIARYPEKHGADALCNIENDNEDQDEPFRPTVGQPEQCDGERRLAAGDSKDGHEAGCGALDAEGKQVLEWHLVVMKTEPETGIRCRSCAADEEEDLDANKLAFLGAPRICQEGKSIPTRPR